MGKHQKKMTFGDFIKRVAARKGLSLYALAKKAGKNDTNGIYPALNGSNMNVKNVFKFLEALDEDLIVLDNGEEIKLINN